MPAHSKAYERLTYRIQRLIAKRTHTRVPGTYQAYSALIDQVLDEWYDIQYRATEWDADMWGFSESWMARERSYMNKRSMDKVNGRWYTPSQVDEMSNDG